MPGILLSPLCTLLGANHNPARCHSVLLLDWITAQVGSSAPAGQLYHDLLPAGLESVLEQAIAILRFHILQITFFQGTTTATIFIFAFFEYTIL